MVLQLPGIWERDQPKCHCSTFIQAQAMSCFQLLEILFVSGRRMLMLQHPLSRFYHSCDDCAVKCQVVLTSHPISHFSLPPKGKHSHQSLLWKLLLYKAAGLVPSRPLPASVSACSILQNGQELDPNILHILVRLFLVRWTLDFLPLSLQCISTTITCFQVKQLSVSNQGRENRQQSLP